MVKTGLAKAIDSLVPLDEHFATFQGYGYSRKGTKRKPKPNKAKHGKERTKSSRRDQTANSPKKSSFPPQNPVTTGMSPHTFSSAKPLLSLAKIISSTLLTHPSCIKAMLAIPHLSQVSSMAKIDSKEAQMKSKAGICFGFTSHNKHTSFLLSKEAQAASPRLRL
ncbi:hypothetical protein Tco_0401302 [Tanacetum coccineum]